MTIPLAAKKILDFIGSIEAPRGYGTVYGNNQNKLPKPLTSMTLKEVLVAQKDWTRQFGSSAAGRYQFMRRTLLDLAVKYKLKAEQQFHQDFQDQLGLWLLERRKFKPWLADQISTDDFMLELAKEWASFPVPRDMSVVRDGKTFNLKRGQSYYAGDGVNKALVDPSRVWLVLEGIRKGKEATPPVPLPKPEPEITDEEMKEFMEMLQAAAPILASALINILAPKLEEMFRRQDVPIQASAPPETAAREVAAELARTIQANPSAVVKPKGTLQSTTIHGLIVSGIGLAASIFGYTVTEAETTAIVTLGGQIVTGIGLVWAWIGRQKAVQPLT